MQSQFPEWLAVEKAAGRSGFVFTQLPIVRGEAYELGLTIPADVSGDAFDAAIYVGPDAGNTALATFTVDVGEYDSEAGITPITLTLAATETDDEPPADGDLDGLTEVIFKMTQTPDGGEPRRVLSLSIPVVE